MLAISTLRSFRTRLSLESMEARFAPATLIELNTLASQSAAGHTAIVASSKPVVPTGDAGSVRVFDAWGAAGHNPIK